MPEHEPKQNLVCFMAKCDETWEVGQNVARGRHMIAVHGWSFSKVVGTNRLDAPLGLASPAESDSEESETAAQDDSQAGAPRDPIAAREPEGPDEPEGPSEEMPSEGWR